MGHPVATGLSSSHALMILCGVLLGAGFGGCCLALYSREEGEKALYNVKKEYVKRQGVHFKYFPYQAREWQLP
ncbi:MAG: hypothetical protein FWF06_04765 [Symbiobacteriaceae bacterium]|nr:hypothetical protein [Symbiobacteriaceae bacterium]